jgi:hypothetical protein
MQAQGGEKWDAAIDPNTTTMGDKIAYKKEGRRTRHLLSPYKYLPYIQYLPRPRPAAGRAKGKGDWLTDTKQNESELWSSCRPMLIQAVELTRRHTSATTSSIYLAHYTLRYCRKSEHKRTQHKNITKIKPTNETTTALDKDIASRGARAKR